MNCFSIKIKWIFYTRWWWRYENQDRKRAIFRKMANRPFHGSLPKKFIPLKFEKFQFHTLPVAKKVKKYHQYVKHQHIRQTGTGSAFFIFRRNKMVNSERVVVTANDLTVKVNWRCSIRSGRSVPSVLAPFWQITAARKTMARIRSCCYRLKDVKGLTEVKNYKMK